MKTLKLILGPLASVEGTRRIYTRAILIPFISRKLVLVDLCVMELMGLMELVLRLQRFWATLEITVSKVLIAFLTCAQATDAQAF